LTEGPLKIKKVDRSKKDALKFTLTVPQFLFIKVTIKKYETDYNPENEKYKHQKNTTGR
jgi:hypothetical protein